MFDQFNHCWLVCFLLPGLASIWSKREFLANARSRHPFAGASALPVGTGLVVFLVRPTTACKASLWSADLQPSFRPEHAAAVGAARDDARGAQGRRGHAGEPAAGVGRRRAGPPLQTGREQTAAGLERPDHGRPERLEPLCPHAPFSLAVVKYVSMSSRLVPSGKLFFHYQGEASFSNRRPATGACAEGVAIIARTVVDFLETALVGG